MTKVLQLNNIFLESHFTLKKKKKEEEMQLVICGMVYCPSEDNLLLVHYYMQLAQKQVQV